MKSFVRLVRVPVVGVAWVLGAVGAVSACGSEAADDGDAAGGGSSGAGTVTGGSSGASGSAGASGAAPTGGTGATAGAGVGGSVTGGAGGAGAASGTSGAAGTGTGGTTAGAGGSTAGTSGAAGAGVGGTTAGAGGSTAGTGAGGAGAGAGGANGGRGGVGGASGGSGGKAGSTGMAGAAGKSGGPLPAFPGADGAAGLITGGRGGDVCHVTVLDQQFGDTRAGTLNACLQGLSGARTVVFDISGVFSLGRGATSGYTFDGNGWDTASRLNIPANVTLAGQSAPGPVIIMGGSVRPGATNIIVRNITVAPGYGRRGFHEQNATPPTSGDFPDSYVFDAFDISGQNVMLDHVTTVFATDETISCNELANNLTIQYSNISQGQNYPQADAEASGVSYTGHALGSLLQAGSNARISVIFNLYAHQKGRLPRFGTEADALTTAGVGAYNDFRNNVIYNWLGTAGTGASGQVFQGNFISNFYLAGPGGDNPSGGTSTAVTNASGGTSVFNGSDGSLAKLYHSGNMKDTNKDGDASDGAVLANSDFGTSSFQGSAYTQTPFRGVTATASAAYTYVLNHVGARWWQRGPVDTRLIAETRAGSGKIIAWGDDPFNSSTSEGAEWRALAATASMSRAAGFDSDNDGMPNTWESTNGTNPNTADNNGDLDADGYTNLEEYLNEIAAWPAVAAVQFTGRQNSRYAMIQNWTIAPSPNHTGTKSTAVWQPSRYDVAQITAGTSVVDAMGQHAGTLEIGRAGALDITNGWLDAERSVTVGGRLSLRSGALWTRELAKSPRGGDFEFVGGSLSAELVKFDLVNDGGTLAPGRDGVGTTNVAGDVRLRSGAYVVNVTHGANDTLRASGTVTLGGALRIETNGAYEPHVGQTWTIVVADGGVTGRFTSVTEGYVVNVVGNRVIVTYGEALECVAVREDDTTQTDAG